jgi:hypothetical protein
MTQRVLKSAFFYVLVVFGLGFVLGALRIFMIAPAFGETLAVLLELPVMLGFSWWISGLILRRIGGLFRLSERIWMGGLALVLLLSCEFLLSVLGFGLSVPAFFQHYHTLHGAIRLAGQVVFGAIPALRWVLGQD